MQARRSEPTVAWIAAQDVEQSEGGAAGAAAAQRAAALLADTQRCSAALALQTLPWLVEASPTEALAVLKVESRSSTVH